MNLNENKQEKVHHEFSPSQLPRIAECPGSVRMSRLLKNIPVPVNEELEKVRSIGNMLHEAMETGDLSELSAEDSEIVLNTIRQVVEITNGKDEEWKELKVDIKDLSGNVISYGYIDYACRKKDWLIIIDYKFGFNESESAEDSIQTMAYMVGLMQMTGLKYGKAYIIQPRLNKTTEVQYVDELEAMTYAIQSTIQTAHDKFILSKNKHCAYCPVFLKHACPVWNEEFSSLAISKVSNDFSILNADQAGDMYEKAVYVEKICKAIKESCKSYAKNNDGRIGSYILSKRSGNKSISSLFAMLEDKELNLNVEDVSELISISYPDACKAYVKKRQDECAKSGAKVNKKTLESEFNQIVSGKNYFVQGAETEQIVKRESI